MLGARGPWRKLKEIGKGSFGLVYLVQRSGGDGKTFVMKEVNLRGLPRTEMIAAQNEVAVMKKLKHPNIVGIEEALVVEDVLCIIMEWAEGKDLGALVEQRRRENRPFSEQEILRIFWQLTSALAHCHHDHHMLHRDLKPQNVFLSKNGDVKLGDFGLAKIIEATCALVKTQCGTPIYMSPELCMGQDYNRGADVYALGCILYELMTLTMPWADVQYNAAGGFSAFLKKIASSSLDLTKCKQRYSLELCNLLAALIHRNPRNRPALKQVLQMDLVAAAAPKPPAANERPLPPSWKKVPSASRPGEFSYLHVPTGYKQAFPPERDELPAEVQAALAKATFSPGGQKRMPPPTAMGPGPVHTPRQQQQQQQQGTPGQRGTPRQLFTPGQQATPGQRQMGTPGQQATPGQRQLGTPGQQATPRQHTPGSRPSQQQQQRGADGGGPHGEASRALKAAIDSALPPSWRKVPSASRPGQFSYLHVPTGYKQSEVPTSDAPSPAALAAWQRANGTANAGRPPATAMGGGPGGRMVPPSGVVGRLEPVAEVRSNMAQHAFGAAQAQKGGRPPSAPLARGPNGQYNQQQQQGQRPRGLV